MATNENVLTRRIRHKVAENIYNEIYPDPEEEEAKLKKAREQRKPASPYSIQNVLWLIGAVAVFYYTDFALACLYDPDVKRTWFNIGAILLAIHVSIAGFLIIFLTYIKKIPSDDWEQHYPAAIPLATAAFAFGSFCVTVGLWPVWGVLTPFILFSLFMGVVVTIVMIPGSF